MPAMRRKRLCVCPIFSLLFVSIAAAFLFMVYTTAYNVGVSSMVTSAQQRSELTARILKMKSDRQMQCTSHVEMLRDGQATALQAVESAYAIQMKLKLELELLESRNALVLQSIVKCKEQKSELQDGGNKATLHEKLRDIQNEVQRYEATIAAVTESISRLTGDASSRSITTNTSMKMPPLQRAAIVSTAMMREVDGLATAASSTAALLTKCSGSNTRYSIVFDAGSTGSRVHVFSYDFTPSLHADKGSFQNSTLLSLRLKDELFVENHLPLSGFTNANDAARSLSSLLDAARKYVPDAMHVCTPIELKATAGLRRIGQERAGAILDAVRLFFRNETFWMQSELDSVRILEGKEEGPLAWLTINYLLSALTNNSTAATILDLGGGSTQIVMHPSESKILDGRREFSHFFHVGGRSFALYQHSYEGNGLHAAKEQLIQAVAKAIAAAKKTDVEAAAAAAAASLKEQAVYDRNALNTRDNTGIIAPAGDVSALHDAFPCFPKGFVHAESGISNVKGGSDVPSMEACVALFRQHVVRDHEPCGSATCGFNGVFQPNVTTASIGPVYAFSFFYDRLKPHMGEREEITVQGVADIARRGCNSMRSTDAAARKDNMSGNTGTLKQEMMCIDLSYLFALLHYGYGFPLKQELHIAKRIGGFETSWALGASLAALEGNSL